MPRPRNYALKPDPATGLSEAALRDANRAYDLKHGFQFRRPLKFPRRLRPLRPRIPALRPGDTRLRQERHHRGGNPRLAYPVDEGKAGGRLERFVRRFQYRTAVTRFGSPTKLVMSKSAKWVPSPLGWYPHLSFRLAKSLSLSRIRCARHADKSSSHHKANPSCWSFEWP